MENKLTFEQVFDGMEIIDEDGHKGTILESFDPCNILIQFENGGRGYACLKSDCSEGPDTLYSSQINPTTP